MWLRIVDIINVWSFWLREKRKTKLKWFKNYGIFINSFNRNIIIYYLIISWKDYIIITLILELKI